MTVAAYPIAPAVEDLKDTLLDTVTLEDITPLRTMPGDGSTIGVWPSLSCLTFDESPEFCAPNVKDLNVSVPWQDGLLFGAYGGATCTLIGAGDISEDASVLKGEVEKVFKAGESRAVEMALMAQRFVVNPAGSGLPGEWPVPPDLNAAAAVAPRIALALLEGDAASKYVGVPTIHMPRVIASLLAGIGALEYDGNVLRTVLGTKVAAGGGYDQPNTSPTGVANAAGERWLYITGQVKVQRGELIVRQAIEFEQNDFFVLAERPYIATVDCYTAAVRATVAV